MSYTTVEKKPTEFIEILQAQAAGLLTSEEARVALKRLRPEWYEEQA